MSEMRKVAGEVEEEKVEVEKKEEGEKEEQEQEEEEPLTPSACRSPRGCTWNSRRRSGQPQNSLCVAAPPPSSASCWRWTHLPTWLRLSYMRSTRR